MLVARPLYVCSAPWRSSLRIILSYLWATGGLPDLGALEGLGVSTRAAIQIGCVVALLLVFALTLGRLIRASGTRTLSAVDA